MASVLRTPPDVTGERRPLSEHCDVIINDVPDGVTVVAALRPGVRHVLQLRFDFSMSDNLTMRPSDDAQQTGAMTCSVTLRPSLQPSCWAAVNVCWLAVDDPVSSPSFGVSYSASAYVLSEKGEFVPLAASGENGGLKAAGAVDKKSAVSATLDITIRTVDGGYVVLFTNTGRSSSHAITLEFADSENLQLAPVQPPGTTVKTSTMVSCEVVPGSGDVEAARLVIRDKLVGASNLSYRVSAQEVPFTSPEAVAEQQRRQREAEKMEAAEAARQAALAEAERQAALAEAARQAALAEAARQAALVEAERQAALAEAARQAALVEAARQAALAEAERQAVEAAAAVQKKQMAAKLLALRDAAVRVQEEERLARIKVEAEWKVRFGALIQGWCLSVCALCNQPLPTRGYQTAAAGPVAGQRMHPACADQAPKCSHCAEVLIREYVSSKSNSVVKLHKECVEAYKSAARPS